MVGSGQNGLRLGASRVWVFALVLIATGIADHYLLFKTMRPTDDAEEEEEATP